MVCEIKIKPLSVNSAWQGQRFKTRTYDFWRQECLLLLPNTFPFKFDPLDSEIELHIIYGVSSKAIDLDNLLKTFIDSLQLKYNFDDKKIMKIICEKTYVPKGKEYIEFSMEKILDNNNTHIVQ